MSKQSNMSDSLDGFFETFCSNYKESANKLPLFNSLKKIDQLFDSVLKRGAGDNSFLLLPLIFICNSRSFFLVLLC